ncbi:MAG TPA: hypothetical protein PKE20_04210, partial [Promineifilum sp.]|nr:hypothetical protein [Promineifilum sp.]
FVGVSVAVAVGVGVAADSGVSSPRQATRRKTVDRQRSKFDGNRFIILIQMQGEAISLLPLNP